MTENSESLDESLDILFWSRDLSDWVEANVLPGRGSSDPQCRGDAR